LETKLLKSALEFFNTVLNLFKFILPVSALIAYCKYAFNSLAELAA
jgi:hypothetical protein